MNKEGKIYLAGHNGLVGSAIFNALNEAGYHNIVYRTFEELDLTNQAAVADFFAHEKPDYVFIAAAKVGGIVANNTYRGQFIYENLMIQSNVIHQAYEHGVKKLLFLGSTCIYPRECPQPMKEQYLLTGPLEQTNEPYAIAKIAGLKMCENYNRQYGTTFMSVMPTNLYGPNDNFDLEKSHVLPALLRKIHLGKLLEENNWDGIRRDMNANPVEQVNGKHNEDEILEVLAKYGVARKKDKVAVEIWGTGKPMREFMYSTDMAAACVHLMTTPRAEKVIKESPEFSWINVGTSKEISISGLAELIKKETGFRGELYFDTTKPDGTPQKLTDTSRLNALGYKSKIPLEKGLGLMYKAYLDRQNT